MSIKNEKGDPADEDFDKAVKDVIEQLEQAHYWHTKVRIPTLDEVRRKIVLFRRYALADSSAKLGIEAAPSHWKDNDQFSFTNDDGVLFDIQDIYSAFRRWNVREKFDKYVRDALNTARGNEGSNTLYVNFTSAGYSGGLYPRTIAYGYMLIREDFEGINVMFSNWLQDNKSNQRLGIIPMDCPEERNNGVLPSQLVYRNDFNRYETRLVNGCIYEIHAGQSLGSALNVRGNLSSPGTQVMLFHSTGGKNTQWKLDDGGNNSSVLRPQNAPELVLAVEGAKTADKTPAIISEYRNEPHQKWLVVGGPAGLPFFHITPGHSPGKALEVYGGNVADHTPATLWEYNGSPAQIWLFMMVGFASNRVYTLSPRCAARRCFVGRIVPGGVGTRLNYGIQPANGGTEQQWKLAGC
jgi:Ricin-type beta-trefoil lectin domain-like